LAFECSNQQGIACAPPAADSGDNFSERNHRGVGNRLLEPSNVVAFSTEPVQHRERLGGLLSFHHREAAWVLCVDLRPKLFYLSKIFASNNDRQI